MKFSVINLMPLFFVNMVSILINSQITRKRIRGSHARTTATT